MYSTQKREPEGNEREGWEGEQATGGLDLWRFQGGEEWAGSNKKGNVTNKYDTIRYDTRQDPMGWKPRNQGRTINNFES